MKKTDISTIENIIQYKFKNQALLNQAFDFEPGDENDPRSNGILRIIGRRSFDYALTNILIEYYGSVSKNNPLRTTNGNTTIYDLLDNLTSYDLLKAFITILDLTKYVESYSGGELVEVERKLFFAIVGAITVDLSFDVKEIAKIISYFIDIDYWLDNGFNDILAHPFISLFNECASNDIELPKCNFKSIKDAFGNEFIECILNVGEAEYKGVGNTLSEARIKASLRAKEELKNSKKEKSIKEDAGEFDENNAMDVLDNLTLKGYFSFADYESKVENGGYLVICSISEISETFEAFDKDKGKARNMAAYKMLEFLVNNK